MTLDGAAGLSEKVRVNSAPTQANPTGNGGQAGTTRPHKVKISPELAALAKRGRHVDRKASDPTTPNRK